MSAKAKPSISVSTLMRDIKSRVKSAKDSNTPTDPDNKGAANPTPDPANPEASLNMLANKDNKGSPGAAEPVETVRTGDPLPEGAQPGRTGTPEIADPAHGVKHAGIKDLSRTMSVLRTKLAAAGRTAAAPTAPSAADVTKVAADASAAAAKTEQTPAAEAEDGLRKLAAALVTTERGRQAAEAILLEQLGAQQAADLVKQAADLAHQEAQEEQAALDEFHKAAAAVEQHRGMVKRALAELPVNEQEQVIKVAVDLQQDMAALELPEDIALFKMGAADAADMMGQADPSAALGGMPDEEMLAAMEQGGGGGGEPSPQELLAMLEQLVASGQIPPEVAEQLAAAIQQDMEGQVKEAAVKGVFESADLADVVGADILDLVRAVPAAE